MLDWLQTDPVAFTIPFGDGFDIYWYGIIVTLGIFLGALWGAREIEKRGQDVDEFYNGLMIVIFAGYFFARLAFVLLDVIGNDTDYESWVDVINIRQGGVNILGGFIGAVLVALAYTRWRKLDLWHYADVTGPTLLLAQAIGRWGNFVGQELYGPPTELPWGILIQPASRLPEYAFLPPETRFHPTFLYESLWLLVGFFLLTWLNKRFRGQWQKGTLFGVFLIWWGVGRAWVELFRPDQANIGDSFVTYSMLMAVSFAIAGILVVLNRLGKLERASNKPIKPKPKRAS